MIGDPPRLRPYAVGVFGFAGPLGPLGPVVFRVESGVTALYGLNGAGKSNLLDAIAGMAAPWSWARTRRRSTNACALVAYYEIPASIDFVSVVAATLDPGGEDLDFPAEGAVLARVTEILGDGALAAESIERGRLGVLVHARVDNDPEPELLIGVPIGSMSSTMRSWLAKFTVQSLEHGSLALRGDEPPIGYFSGIGVPARAWELWDNELFGPSPGILWSELLPITDGKTLPAWWPDPVACIGRFPLGFRLPSDDDERLDTVALVDVLRESDQVDVAPETVRHLRTTSRGGGDAHGTGQLLSEGEIMPVVLTEVARLQGEATALWQSLIGGDRALECTLHEPDNWADAPPLVWQARVGSRHEAVRLDDLSHAELRWARFAIRWVLLADAPDLVLIDEPEAGLHRSAEANLFEGLKRLSSSAGTPIIVATHSPLALRDAAIRLVHVGSRDAIVDDGIVRRTAADLGLDPADMLQLTKHFLLVEGRHDAVVLEALVGDELRRLRATVVPIRGGANLPAQADAAFLFDFTSASVVAVLDNLADAELIRAVIEELRTSGDGNTQTIIARLNALPASSERRFLREFLARAAGRGRTDRIDAWGMSKPDVIEYLDMRTLVPNAKVPDWAALRHRFEVATSSSSKKPDFKKWLDDTYQADFSDESLREAAGTLDHVHPDFTGLLQLLERRS